MKKKFVAVAVMACALALSCVALAGCSGGGSSSSSTTEKVVPTEMRFVTGGESGTYYAFGSVIAQHATNNTDVPVTALVGNGSQANIMEMQDGNAELAFCQSDVEAYAYEGTNIFEEDGKIEGFSTVACLYDEQVQLVTCDPNIKSVADLKGKHVSIGAAGSGVYFNALDFLAAYDMTIDDIDPTYESFADTAASIKDGKIDAGFVVAGAPTTAITDLATSKDVYIVSLDQEHIDKLLAASPYYSAATIPAGTYTGQDEDVTTVAVGAVILAKDEIDDEVIYNFVADIYDNAPNLTDSHAKYAELSIEKAASITAVPYHPGAAKYFSEHGQNVATK